MLDNKNIHIFIVFFLINLLFFILAELSMILFSIRTPITTLSVSTHFPLFPSPVAQRLKRLPRMRETRVQSLGWEDPLEKEMATHSSILAWKIPRTEESGWLRSMQSQMSQTQLSD